MTDVDVIRLFIRLRSFTRMPDILKIAPRKNWHSHLRSTVLKTVLAFIRVIGLRILCGVRDNPAPLALWLNNQFVSKEKDFNIYLEVSNYHNSLSYLNNYIPSFSCLMVGGVGGCHHNNLDLSSPVVLGRRGGGDKNKM